MEKQNCCRIFDSTVKPETVLMQLTPNKEAAPATSLQELGIESIEHPESIEVHRKEQGGTIIGSSWSFWFGTGGETFT